MHKYLLFLAISFSFFHLNAQSLHTLDVWGTSMWPDTSTLGATVHFDLILENTDSASAYNDIIDLHFFVDSGAGFAIADTISLGTQMIPLLDTATFLVSHLIDPLKYAPGNNVVVIWPINGGGAAGDSATLDIYILAPNSLKEVGKNELLSVFPNPSCKYIFVAGLGLGNVFYYSIHSTNGSLLQSGQLAKNGKIDIENLQKGAYVLSLRDGLFEKGVRFIKN